MKVLDKAFVLPLILGTVWQLSQCLSVTKPNVIFVHVDSMDGRTALPDSPALTPNIDQLASRGVRFDNTYCAAPECVPSRAAIWSGRRPDQTKVWSNGHGLPPGYPIIMDQLTDNGYDTEFIGRHDFASGHHSLSANLSSWTRAVPNFAIPSEGRPKFDIKDTQNIRVHSGDWTNSDKCVEWLREKLNSSDTNTPFMLSCGFSCPHPTYVTSKYWYDKGVKLDAITMPVWVSEEKMHIVQHYETVTKNCSGDWSDDDIKNIRATYYAMVAEADAFVGQIFKFIENSSYINNTYIFFWSDHGDMTMEHKQFYKETTLEGSSRVPLIIAGPSHTMKQGVTIKRVTSLIDMFPTVMDITGTSHPAGLAGFSLAQDLGLVQKSTLELQPSPHPDWVLCQAHMDHSNTGQFMIRQGDWKYIYYAAGYQAQLFNLANDPGEQKNLADSNPEMVQKLRTILTSQLDPEEVDKQAKTFDKDSFLTWKTSLGDKYNSTIGSPAVRWYPEWSQNPDYYLSLIDTWLKEL